MTAAEYIARAKERVKARTYAGFKARVEAAKISLAELRCDVPPTQAVDDLMDDAGLAAYERHVARYEREVAGRPV